MRGANPRPANRKGLTLWIQKKIIASITIKDMTVTYVHINICVVEMEMLQVAADMMKDLNVNLTR